MSKILLLPHGTAGDVLPYIWIGRQMLKRGHQVTMIWVQSFRQAAEQAGLNFVALENDGFDELMGQAAIWKPGEGMRLGYEFAGRCTAKCMKAIEEHRVAHGEVHLTLGPMMSYAGRLLREKRGIPFISTYIHPMPFVSAHEVPGGLPAAKWLRRLPLPLRRLILSSAAPYDRFALPSIRQCCLDHGVKPPRSLRRGWYHSPDGVLALFPAWYARPQPDWPANTFQWDFPLEDVADANPLSSDLNDFLDSGTPPVVFTLGTGHRHARRFFEVAAEISLQRGGRAVFVTRDLQQAPPALPSSIFVTMYAAFSLLLPRAAAVVHHGGTGTTAMCLAAGVPQLIIPLTFDQPDNAERVERMGAGRSLTIGRFTVGRAAPLLKVCLEDPGIHQAAAACARQMRQRPEVEELAAWLELKCAPHAMNS